MEHLKLSFNHSSLISLTSPYIDGKLPGNLTTAQDIKLVARTATIFLENNTMAGLYTQVNVQELQRDAEDSLLHYGTKFYPEFIINASGQTITTAYGHRMLDWTSGKTPVLATIQSLILIQVKCLVLLVMATQK